MQKTALKGVPLDRVAVPLLFFCFDSLLPFACTPFPPTPTPARAPISDLDSLIVNRYRICSRRSQHNGTKGTTRCSLTTLRTTREEEEQAAEFTHSDAHQDEGIDPNNRTFLLITLWNDLCTGNKKKKEKQ